MSQNKKHEKVRKLWEKGERDVSKIARRLGYIGNALNTGVQKVREILKELNLN